MCFFFTTNPHFCQRVKQSVCEQGFCPESLVERPVRQYELPLIWLPPLSAGRRVRPGVLQRHLQMFRPRGRPGLQGPPGAKGDQNTHTHTRLFISTVEKAARCRRLNDTFGRHVSELTLSPLGPNWGVRLSPDKSSGSSDNKQDSQ